MSTGCSTISISRVLLVPKLVHQDQNELMRKLTGQESQKRKLEIQLDAPSFQYQIISTQIIPRPFNPNSAGRSFMKALLPPKVNSQTNRNCLIYLPPPSRIQTCMGLPRQHPPKRVTTKCTNTTRVTSNTTTSATRRDSNHRFTTVMGTHQSTNHQRMATDRKSTRLNSSH